MNNINKYKDELKKAIKKDDADYYTSMCTLHDCILKLDPSCDLPNCGADGCTLTCDKCIHLMLDWMASEYKEYILDKEEREYLSYALIPFKNKIKYIKKMDSYDAQVICVQFNDGKFFEFPPFDAYTMYKGMKLGKKYTWDNLKLYDPHKLYTESCEDTDLKSSKIALTKEEKDFIKLYLEQEQYRGVDWIRRVKSLWLKDAFELQLHMVHENQAYYDTVQISNNRLFKNFILDKKYNINDLNLED